MNDLEVCGGTGFEWVPGRDWSGGGPNGTRGYVPKAKEWSRHERSNSCVIGFRVSVADGTGRWLMRTGCRPFGFEHEKALKDCSCSIAVVEHRWAD